MSKDRKTVLVSSMPAEIKEEAIKRAATSLNDEIVGVLARRFKVAFSPVGRRGPTEAQVGDNGKMLLRMPPRLKQKIASVALRDGTNLSNLICRELAEEYGLEYEATSSRSIPFGGGRRAGAAA